MPCSPGPECSPAPPGGPAVRAANFTPQWQRRDSNAGRPSTGRTLRPDQPADQVWAKPRQLWWSAGERDFDEWFVLWARLYVSYKDVILISSPALAAHTGAE